MRNAANPSPSIEPKCQFGVAIFEDGSMKEIKVGTFTAWQAEEIAKRLVILASAIRNTVRRSSGETAAGNFDITS